MFNILIIIFMKKRNLFMLPCIAAVAIATFVAKKTFETNAFKTNSLLMQNVEALTENEPEILQNELVVCMGPRCNVSYIKSGKISTIEHLHDSIDIKTKYSVSKCCSASLNESGDFQGNNTTINYRSIGSDQLIGCVGEANHIFIEEAMYEFEHGEN